MRITREGSAFKSVTVITATEYLLKFASSKVVRDSEVRAAVDPRELFEYQEKVAVEEVKHEIERVRAAIQFMTTWALSALEAQGPLDEGQEHAKVLQRAGLYDPTR